MRRDQLRYLFGYDRWGTRRVLDAAARLPEDRMPTWLTMLHVLNHDTRIAARRLRS